MFKQYITLNFMCLVTLFFHLPPKGKCKIVPVLVLSEYHAMKAYWAVEV
jgi:hypothetical protein